MKIVINGCYGGFSVSEEALFRLRELGSSIALKETAYGEVWPDSGKINNFSKSHCRNIGRTDPLLIQVIEELGKKANGEYADLKVIDIQDNISYEITEYDGIETVEETHKSWS